MLANASVLVAAETDFVALFGLFVPVLCILFELGSFVFEFLEIFTKSL